MMQSPQQGHAMQSPQQGHMMQSPQQGHMMQSSQQGHAMQSPQQGHTAMQSPQQQNLHEYRDALDLRRNAIAFELASREANRGGYVSVDVLKQALRYAQHLQSGRLQQFIHIAERMVAASGSQPTRPVELGGFRRLLNR